MPTAELIFRAMSDPTRQGLLRVLSARDLSVSDLVEVLGLPQSTVSRHLKVLREAGLLVDRRSGPTVMYAVPPVSQGSHKQSATGTSAGTGAPAADGAAALRNRLLEWVGQLGIEPDVAARLERVAGRRRAESRSFFDVAAARWDQLRIEAFGDQFHFEALAALLPMEWVVADVGSGTGYLLPVLSARFRKVIAVDPAPQMLEVARGRPEVSAAGNVEFREGALGGLPLADGEVDLAVVSLVLHHVERPAEAIADLGRSVKAGGAVMIVEQRDHRHPEFRERMADRWWGFEPVAVADWLREAGFIDVRTLPLASARPTGRRRVDAPGLFVATGRKPPV